MYSEPNGLAPEGTWISMRYNALFLSATTLCVTDEELFQTTLSGVHGEGSRHKSQISHRDDSFCCCAGFHQCALDLSDGDLCVTARRYGLNSIHNETGQTWILHIEYAPKMPGDMYQAACILREKEGLSFQTVHICGVKNI